MTDSQNPSDTSESSKLDLLQLQQYWDTLHSAQQQGRLTPLATVTSPSSPGLVNRLGNREQRKCLEAAWACADPLSGMRVLDLGCGTGRWLEYLRAKGAQAVGIDWSFQAVRSVHRILGVPALQMSIDLLSFQPGAFDAVNCVTVLQHVPPEAQKTALAEVHRILKPGGWFCFFEACSTPAAAAHMFPRAREEWTAMAEAAGFEVVACERSYFGLTLRLYIRLRHAIRLRVAPPVASNGAQSVPQRQHFLSRLQTPLVSSLALVCYPLGRMLRLVRLTEPLHCAFLVRRPSSNSGKVQAAGRSRTD